jgi:hypothetical protein
MILNPVLWVYIYIYNVVSAPQSQKPSILASLSQSLSNVPNFKQTITAICNLPMFHFQPFLFFFSPQSQELCCSCKRWVKKN